MINAVWHIVNIDQDCRGRVGGLVYCGTPEVTGNGSEKLLLHIVRGMRNMYERFSKLSQQCLCHVSRIEWETESKALRMSKYITSV